MADHRGSNIERSEHYGALQRIVDTLFYEEEMQVASRGAAHGERPAPASQGADGSDAACGDNVASAASGAGAFAERFGVSAHTAALLGLAAFDEEMGVGTAVSDEAIPEDPAEFTVRRCGDRGRGGRSARRPHAHRDAAAARRLHASAALRPAELGRHGARLGAGVRHGVVGRAVAVACDRATLTIARRSIREALAHSPECRADAVSPHRRVRGGRPCAARERKGHAPVSCRAPSYPFPQVSCFD